MYSEANRTIFHPLRKDSLREGGKFGARMGSKYRHFSISSNSFLQKGLRRVEEGGSKYNFLKTVATCGWYVVSGIGRIV